MDDGNGAGPIEEDDALRDTLQQLGRVSRTASVAVALQVGAIVVERLFGGDLDELHRRGSKHVSLRRLAHHPELPLTARRLYLSVGVYAVASQLPRDPSSMGLDLSHFEAVMPAPRGQQASLLEQAAAERWTVRRLRERVARIARPRRGGRRPRPPLARAALQLERTAVALDEQLSVGAPLDSVEAEALRRLALVLDRLRRVLEMKFERAGARRAGAIR